MIMFVLGLMLLTNLLYADTLYVNASDSSLVNSTNPNVANEPSMYIPLILKQNGSDRTRIYLTFPIGEIPNYKIITKAMCYLYSISATGSGLTLNFHQSSPYTRPITWNTQPSYNTTVMSYTPIFTGIVGVDCTDAFVRAYKEGNPYAYIMIRTDEDGSFNEKMEIVSHRGYFNPNTGMYNRNVPYAVITYENSTFPGVIKGYFYPEKIYKGQTITVYCNYTVGFSGLTWALGIEGMPINYSEIRLYIINHYTNRTMYYRSVIADNGSYTFNVPITGNWTTGFYQIWCYGYKPMFSSAYDFFGYLTVNMSGLSDGSPCTSNDQCESGYCNTDGEGNQKFCCRNIGSLGQPGMCCNPYYGAYCIPEAYFCNMSSYQCIPIAQRLVGINCNSSIKRLARIGTAQEYVTSILVEEKGEYCADGIICENVTGGYGYVYTCNYHDGYSYQICVESAMCRGRCPAGTVECVDGTCAPSALACQYRCIGETCGPKKETPVTEGVSFNPFDVFNQLMQLLASMWIAFILFGIILCLLFLIDIAKDIIKV